MGVDKFSHPLAFPLVLDVSSPSVQVGIANTNGWNKFTSNKNQPMDGLFQSINTLEINLHQVDGVFFCVGPGSTLGLRLALAFIKTLQWERQNKLKLYSYNALDLACKMTKESSRYLQAPFRMGWRLVRSSIDQQAVGKKDIFESEEALEKFPDSYHLQDSRKQNHSIKKERFLEYDLKKIRGLKDLMPISEQVTELEIYSPHPPEFKKWNPQIKFLSPDG